MDEEEKEFRERTNKLIQIIDVCLTKEVPSVGMSAMQTLLLTTAIKFNIDKEEFLEQIRQHWDETEKFLYQLEFEKFIEKLETNIEKAVRNN